MIPESIIWGLVAMFGYGLSSAFAQKPAKDIGSERAVFFRGIITSAIIFMALIYTTDTASFTISTYHVGIALGIALIGFIPIITFYKSLSLGTVGIITPIANSSVIFTILFSVIFFRETLTLTQLGAIALITAGIILISVDFKDLKNSRIFDISSGIPYAIITCLLWGLTFALLKIPVSVIGPIMTSFILEFGICVYAGLYLGFRKNLFHMPSKKTMKDMILVAFTGAIATLSYNIGINVASISTVSAIAFANPLVSVMYARLAFGEKQTKTQLFAGMMIVAGIVIISAF